MKLPNGFGTVYKLSGKRRKPWIVRKTISWDLNEETGKLKQNYATLGYYETRAKALEALSLYNSSPYDIDTAKITFAEIYKQMTSAKYFQNLSDSSKKSYNITYKASEELHKLSFKDIRKPHMQKIIDAIDKGGYATRKKYKVTYSAMYKLALEMDVVNKNYAKFLDIGDDENVKGKTPFTADEIKLLWTHEDNLEYLDTVLILIYSGMRIGEMLDLETENIDLENNVMRGGNKTFAGIDRIIPIHSKIKPFIEKYYNNGHKYLITYPDGKPFTYANYRDSYFDQFMEALGMEHLPHEARHTFISLMDSAGANKICLDKIIGHAGKGTREKVYTHKTIEELKQNIELIKC
ncbi:MAG: tyrosine-type recombinase/integrase [Aminipila sp.]